LEHYLTEVIWRWIGVSPITSTMTSFSGMAQQGIGVRCVMVDARRTGALVWHHGSIYGRSVEGFADLSLEDALWFNGSDGSCCGYVN
jgi:hypothetical protein